MKPLATDIESRLWWTMGGRIKSPYRLDFSTMAVRLFWVRLGRGNA